MQLSHGANKRRLCWLDWLWNWWMSELISTFCTSLSNFTYYYPHDKKIMTDTGLASPKYLRRSLNAGPNFEYPTVHWLEIGQYHWWPMGGKWPNMVIIPPKNGPSRWTALILVQNYLIDITLFDRGGLSAELVDMKNGHVLSGAYQEPEKHADICLI